VSLPASFLEAPIAHRALHGPGAPENSREAVRRAVKAGYGIEIDLQLSADRDAMVFHDATLDRVTAQSGPVHMLGTSTLKATNLTGDDRAEGIPTLADILSEVAGRVPLLIELKDQSGGQGGSDGVLEQATADVLRGYDGPVAVMSFNPDQVDRLASLCPDVPRGITTCAFRPEYWRTMPAAVAARLRAIPDVDRVGASFISHDRRDLDAPRVAELGAQGLSVLTWTIRSPEEEAEARRVAQNVTFEGYLPPLST